MKALVILMMVIPFLSYGQNDGIRFETGLNWKQVKAKAKKENKYIFLDCFTTWCGPCKLMEKDIYPDSAVGSFFNAHFISVKSQMDKTGNDNEQVKNWYADANCIQNEYGIPAYPTYLFFSPDGKLVNRDLGYKGADDFLVLGKTSATPGFKAPYERFYALLKDFLKWHKNYDVVPALIDTAKLLGQDSVLKMIASEYFRHLKVVSQQDLYTKANIKFISAFMNGSSSRFFQMFYPDGEKVDAVMNEKNYAEHVVSSIIDKEEVVPFAQLNTGMASTGPAIVRPEPDWNQLIRNIGAKYKGDYADRLVIIGKIRWYGEQQDWPNCAKWFTELNRKYHEYYYSADDDLQIFNSISWSVIFARSVDKEQIDLAIEAMKEVVRRVEYRGEAPFNFMDTYANLLYKADRRKEAIEWEEKAWHASIKWSQPPGRIDGYLQVISKMKRGEPTWPHYIAKDAFFN